MPQGGVISPLLSNIYLNEVDKMLEKAKEVTKRDGWDAMEYASDHEQIDGCFGRFESQPVARVIEVINPILRGWVNYFAIGSSSRCFRYVRDWVEKKVRRHLARACKRSGFGWKRWSRTFLYETLGLFDNYKVNYGKKKVVPA